MSRGAKARSLKAVPNVDVEAPKVPTTEEIALRAYEIYQARGGSPGADVDDWLRAERELTQSVKSVDAIA